MNAVNWGMRGECGPLLGLHRDLVIMHCSQLSIWQTIMAPPWALSKPRVPFHFPPSPLILSGPWPWVISSPFIPSAFPEPSQSACFSPSTAELQLPASPPGRGKHSEPDTLFPEKIPWASHCDALPPASSRSSKQAQTGPHQTLEESPWKMKDFTLVLHGPQTLLISILNITKNLSLDQPNPFLHCIQTRLDLGWIQ